MVLVCGLPNAGKTTYSKRYAKVIHYDDIPLITPKRYEYINEHIEDDICIEGVFGEKQRRIDIVNACKSKGAKAVCVWLDTPKTECLKRENRGRPYGIIKLHASTFKPPSYDEGWDEIITIINYESNNTKRKIGRPGQRHWDKGKAPAAADD